MGIKIYRASEETIQWNIDLFLNKSIPKIIIDNNYIERSIYPSVNCEPIKFDPKGKHYVSFIQGKAYHNHCSAEINIDSLNKMLRNDFSFFRTETHHIC